MPRPDMHQSPASPATSLDWTALAARLRRYSLALTRDTHEADDLTQQTLAAVLAKGTSVADAEAYAITAATRLWMMRQRSIGRGLRRIATLAMRRASFEMRHPSESPESDEQRAALEAAMGTLAPKQRAAFVLKVVEGLDYAAIAAAMECDVGAVRANLHLARTKLKQKLSGRDGDER